MITLIIGQNAIGKTAYLHDKVQDMSQNQKKNVISNLLDSSYLKNIKYNQERMEQLRDILDTDNITENIDKLAIQTDEVKVTDKFASVITLICKDLDYLYLDEPEFGLTYKQTGFLVWFLNRVEDTFKEIEIVTHSEMLLSQLQNTTVKTIIYNSIDKKFTKVDLKEDYYVTID
jgi:predicted ATPase